MQIRSLLPDHGEFILDLGHSDLTVRSYAYDLEVLCRYLHKKLGHEPEVADLTRPVLQKWVTHDRVRGLGPATIERRRCSMRSFLAFLEDRGLPYAADAGSYRIPKREDPEPRYLTKEDARRLIESPGKLASVQDLSPRDQALCLRDACMLILDYEIGARRSEVVALNLKSLRWGVPADGSLVVVVKGKRKKFREVDVTHAREPLLAWLAVRNQYAHHRSQALFTSFKTTGRLSSDGYYEVVARWAQRVGLTAGPHLLRYSFATHLRDNGVDLAIIQLLLGHARLTTTKLYAHATRQAMRAANQRHPLNAPDRECLTQEEMLERILAQVASLSDSASKNQARMEQMDAILTQLHGLHRPRLDSVSPG